MFLIVGKFWAWVSQPSGPVPRSLNVTNETPASTSRRASRHDWPTVVRPYLSRTAADSSIHAKRRLGRARGQQRIGPLGELIAAGGQRRARDVVGEVVELLDHLPAPEQPLERELVGGRQVLDPEGLLVGIARDRERVVSRRQIAARGEDRGVGNRDIRRQHARASPRVSWTRRCRSRDTPGPATGDSRSAGGARPGRGRPRARSCSGSR